MLTRLMKYELRATARLFIPLYIALIIMSAVNRIFPLIAKGPVYDSLFGNVTTFISMTVYVTLMIGIFVMTLIALIQRFYKNLLGNEGYLMFTLPVQSWKHILNKLITAMMWIILSGIVALISIFIITPENEMLLIFNNLPSLIKEIWNYFGAKTLLLGLEGIVILVLAIASGVLVIYAAISLGHLFNKHKLLASFGMYVVLGIINQIIMSVYAITLDKILNFHDFRIISFSDTQVTVIFFLVYLIIITAGHFALTRYILNNKLNLE
ncbi:MAG: ABC transporter permease [Clostridiales bacterium]|nr:ABC transporter permease [Clostridiales bacterium]